MGKAVSRTQDIDRGWAWVVMASVYMGEVLFCVGLYMSGVIYIALLDTFREGETKTSLVGAISIGLLCFAAPLGGIVNNRFNCRVSIVVGGAVSTIGFVSSAFVPNLNWMIVTGGVCVGIGYGVSSAGLICSIGFYFEKWRDIVIACAFLTVGIAMFISAPLGLLLIQSYGLTSTFLFMACIQAHLCVVGMLCKPSSIELEVRRQREADRIVDAKSKSQTYLDLTLMKNKSYLLFLISISAWNFALCVAIMHLPNYVTTIGGSSREIGLLMSSFSVANFIGRLLGCLTISKLNHRSMHMYIVALGFTGVVTSLFVFYSQLIGATYIFTIQLGIFVGWPNTMATPIALSFVSVKKLSEAYVLVYIFCGIGVTTGPVLVGYLYVISGSYEYSFIVSGGILCLGCLSSAASLCFKNKESINENINGNSCKLSSGLICTKDNAEMVALYKETVSLTSDNLSVAGASHEGIAVTRRNDTRWKRDINGDVNEKLLEPGSQEPA